MRAVFIKGPSQYDATRLFSDQLAAAFAGRGHEAVVVDALAEDDLGAALARVAAEGQADLVHTYFCLGDARALIGRSLGEIFGAPHVLHHVDHPLSHLAQLEATPADTAILTVDPTHVEAVRATMGADRFAHLAFMPHAGVGAPVELDADIDAYIPARPIPILFAGTFYGERPTPWAEEGAGVRAVFDRALDVALAAEFIPALEALDQVLRGVGEDPADPRYARLRLYSTWVHEQVRHVRRQRLLDAAGAAGLPVFCVGAGYEGWIERHKSFRLGPAMGLDDVSALMRRARVVLNVNANFGRGSHERPLTAMLAGAAVATDGAWWTERFVDGREALLWRWTDLDAGLSRLAALANDPEAAWRMGAAGQAKAAASHRFDHRVDGVIAAARAARDGVEASAA
ncbi:glycosyltransferase [Caulobacter sp.]|uniref:glycosyltransferase family protein n=1 Tax=Caulobacter sp. TaxID=78 RepID=UPI00161C2D46